MSIKSAQRILSGLKQQLLDDLNGIRAAQAVGNNDEAQEIIVAVEQYYFLKTREARWQYNFENSALSSLQQEVADVLAQILQLKDSCTPTTLYPNEELRKVQLAHAKFIVALETFKEQTQHLHEKVNSAEINYCEASDTAQKLIMELQTLGDAFFAQEDFSVENTRNFKFSCHQAIRHAKPILEQQQEWGIIFSNFIKSLANAFIYLISVGDIANFFPLKKMEAEVALTALQKSIHKEILPLTVSHNLF